MRVVKRGLDFAGFPKTTNGMHFLQMASESKHPRSGKSVQAAQALNQYRSAQNLVLAKHPDISLHGGFRARCLFQIV